MADATQTLSLGDLWNLLEKTFDQLCAACSAGKLVPLLEADVVGYIYHLLITTFDGDASRIHLATRLVGTSGNDKYDLVIGQVMETEELKSRVIRDAGDIDERTKKMLSSKSIMSGFRPAISGELVLELKHFARGFDPTQLRVHLEQAIQDVGKLKELRSVCPEGRALVLFDDRGYLTPFRQRAVIGALGPEDASVRIYMFHRDDTSNLLWKLLRRPEDNSVAE